MLDENKMTAIQNLLKNHDYHALRQELDGMNPVDIAYFIGQLSAEEATLTFRTLPKDQEVDVFAELDADTQEAILTAVSDREIADIIEDLAVDDAVDMLEEFPAHLVKRVLKNSSKETRALINQFFRYPENSAGSIMTAEYTDLKKGITVEDAIKRIRRTGEDRETIYTCYVMDATRVLEGVVTVKDLLLAHDSQLVDDVMETDVISVLTTEDQEAAAKLLMKYDLMSLPVVDAENRLVGIVTVDDAVDVLQEETTEDFERMAAMAPSERPYLKSGVFSIARNRLPWLLVLMVSGMVTGMILGHYEKAFQAVPLLVTFIPMLTSTGGNAGSQASTMVIRSMALGDVTFRNFWAVVWKETRVALLVAVPLAAVNFVRMLFFYPGNTIVSATVSLAMIATVLLSKMMGGMLPMIANALHIDPALMAAPLITTIVDASTLLVYFTIAGVLLGI